MSSQEVAVGGLIPRRRFERSRLEEELWEAVYDTLLAGSPRPGAAGAPGDQGEGSLCQRPEEEAPVLAAA
jgi:hypothetical protein